MRNWIEGATTFGLAAIAFYLSWRVPDFVSGWSLNLPGTTDRSLSPSFFPQVALTVLAAIAALNGVMALRRARARGRGAVEPIPPDATIRSPAAAIGWMLILVAYLIVMWAVGFYLASVLLILTLGWMSTYRRGVVLVTFAIAMPAAVELLFSRGLSLRLPVGRLFEFSIMSIGTWV